MNGLWWYLLGLFTLPGLWLTIKALFRTLAWLKRHGYTIEIKWGRKPDDISDYKLRHDIWWERARGPIFTGFWRHENLHYQAPSAYRLNRWIGFGRTNGPCVMFFKSRNL